MLYPLLPKAIRFAVPLMLLCMAVLSGGPACAQVAAPFIGAWKATWQTDKRSYEALMTVTDNGGSWQTSVLGHANVCAGREVPMKVESASPSVVKFVLQFAEVIPGCPNATVTLKVAPDGTVTGTRSKFELTLVKQ